MEVFTDEQLEQIRDAVTVKLEWTERKGIDKLIEWMDENGFFTSPCSTQFHLSYKGGLAKHSLNVYETIVSLAKGLCKENAPDMASLVIVSLLHDLGKCGNYGKPMYVENVLKSGKRSDSKPYVTNAELLSIPHEVRSIAIAERFIELTEEEEHAILFHDGLYTGLGYEWKNKEKPLDLLLHWADLWCSRVIEAENEKEGN